MGNLFNGFSSLDFISTIHRHQGYEKLEEPPSSDSSSQREKGDLTELPPTDLLTIRVDSVLRRQVLNIETKTSQLNVKNRNYNGGRYTGEFIKIPKRELHCFPRAQ